MSDLEPEQRIEEVEQALPQQSAAVDISSTGVRLPAPIAAFRHRNYRLFFFGQIISLTGTWLQSVAQSWLIIQLARPGQRALMVGIVSAISAFPVLIFSLFAGLLVDRFRKRNIIVVTQTVMMLLAFVLAALTHRHAVTILSVMIIGFLFGTANSLDAPARQSFVIEMVGREDLENAITTNSAMFNGARVIGPAVAGLVVSWVGIAGAFFLNGLSYVAVIIGLLLMTCTGAPTAKPASQWESLKEGLSFILGNHMVGALMVLTAVVSIFATPYAVLMPVFAKDVLKVGVKELGYLMAATGVGALLGAFTLASLGWVKRKGRLLLLGYFTFCAMLVLFSYSRHLHTGMLLLMGVGWGMIICMALVNTLIQMSVPDHLRGRVVSVYTLMFLGMTPIGSLQAGAIAHYLLGVPGAIRLGAVICAASAVVLSRWFIRYRAE